MLSQIDNAYVSGMKEYLKLGGNDLSHLQSALLIGNCIGQVPGAYFFPKLPLHILIPSLDLGWGIFNLLQYRATGLPELMAYRFFIGLFEVSVFAANLVVHHLTILCRVLSSSQFTTLWARGTKDTNCE